MTVETANIVASASVSSVDFGVTYVETRRSYSGEAGYAKIKGVTDNPDAISLNDDVTASIGGERVFNGSLKKATQDTEGIITIEAYDILYDMHNKLVRLNTEEPRRSTNVLADLFNDAGIGDYVIADSSEFPNNDPPGHHQYGSAQAGDQLSSVVDTIAKRLGAVYWVDRNNTIHIEPFPQETALYDPQYIIEVNSGEDSENKNRILVTGGSKTSEFGLAASHVYSEVSPSSEARFDGQDEDDESNLETLQDNNIVTPKELDSRAMSGLLEQGRSRDAGSITIVGNTAVEIFDSVNVPQLTYSLSGSDQFQNVLSSGTYTVKQVTHLVNAQDGYRTELDLSPEHSSVAESILGSPVGLAGELVDIMTARMREEEDLLAGPTNEAQTE